MQILDHAREWSAEMTDNPGVKGRARTYARAARWQVAARIGADRAVAHVGPARLYCYPGSTEGSGALYIGFLEWNETAFVLRYLRAGDHFVDIGANIGTYSSFAAAFVPGIEVTAVEPGEPFERLTENLRANGIDPARAHNCAVGGFDGTVEFTIGKDVMNSIAVDTDELTRTVRQITLDSLGTGQPPSLVKIDVEGAELDVFCGAAETLDADRPPVLLFELNGRCEEFGHSPSEVTGHLRGLGFECFEYDGLANRLVEFTGDGIPDSNNLVATVDADDVRERLESSPFANGLTPVAVRSKIEWSVDQESVRS